MSEPDFFDRLVQSAAQEANDRAATPSPEDAVTDAQPGQERYQHQHRTAAGWLFQRRDRTDPAADEALTVRVDTKQ